MSKTHSKNMRVLVGGANLSGDVRSVGSLGLTYAMAETSGLEADLVEHLPGMADAAFGPLQALFNDTPAAVGPVRPGSHIILNVQGEPLCSAFIGLGAAPIVGVPAYSQATLQTSYTVTGATGDAVVVNADFTTRANSGNLAAWGNALAVGVSTAVTVNLDSHDNGAQTTGGATAVLHITQSAGAMGANDWAIEIEDSANNTDFDVIGTFLSDGSTATAESLAIAGTIRRYTRAVLTKTAGTDLICWINLIRN